MNPFHKKAAEFRKAGIECAGCEQPLVWAKNKRRPKYCSKSCASRAREIAKRRSPKERLLAERIITPSGCWELTRKAANRFGYKFFTVENRSVSAHRLSYQAFCGPIPEGMCVLHRCDNPGCFNPDHLWLGTLADNNRDCGQKGRAYWCGKTGGKHVASRLTDAEAAEVRRLKKEGMRQKHIAALFNLSQMTVSQIVRGLTYREQATK